MVVDVRRRLSGRVKKRNQVSGFLIDSLTWGGRGELRPRVRHSGDPGEDQNKRKEGCSRAEKGGRSATMRGVISSRSFVSGPCRRSVEPYTTEKSRQSSDIPCAAAPTDDECIDY
ncbi:hypothetical protein BDW67DRAFT_150879 [Aspergillus spinulosporus]